MFLLVDLLSQSSSNQLNRKSSWYQARVIRSSILSSGESPDACSRSLSIAMNYKEISSIMAATGTISPKIYANEITQHEQKKKIFPMQHLSVIDEKTEDRIFFMTNILP